MTTLATDTFVRANQSGWGTASDGINVWSLVRGTTTLAIASNQGTDTVTSGGTFAVIRCGSGTSADTEQVLTFKRQTSADLSGIVCRYTDNSNWYNVNIGAYTNNLVFSKNVAGSYTDVAFGPSVTPTLADNYSIRFRCIGTTIQARMWDTTGAEPGTWDINITDSSLSGAHGFGVMTDPDPGGGTTIHYLNYNATNGSTGGTTTRSLPLRLLLSVQNTRSLPVRLLLRVMHTVSLPVRTRLSVLTTRSLPIRVLLLVQRTLSLPIRLRLLAAVTRSLPIRLRLAVPTALPSTNVTANFRNGAGTGVFRSGIAKEESR